MKRLLFIALLLLAADFAAAQHGMLAGRRRAAGCPAGFASFFDDFDTLDETCRWTVLENGSGTVTQASGEVTIDDPGGATDAALLVMTEPLDRTKNFLACAEVLIDGPESGSYDILQVIDSNGMPSLSATIDDDQRAKIEMQATKRYQVKKYTGSHTENHWRETNEDWSTTFGNSWTDRLLDDYATMCIESRGNTDKWRFLGLQRQEEAASYSTGQGYLLSLVTDWTTWSSIETITDTLYLAFGDGPTNEASDQTVRLNWVLFTTTGDATVPDANYAYVNAATDNTFPFAYNIQAWYTYDLEFPFFVPIDRDPNVLSPGAGGTWDDEWVARPTVVKQGSTYYMTYDGYDGADVDIGCATASDPEGTWTKCTNNPIITDDGGTATDARFPFVQYDEGEVSNNWKIWWSSETGGDEGIYYVEHTALDSGTWPSSTKKLSLGAGDPDDVLIDAPKMIKVGSEWQMWYNCNNCCTWQGCLATSSTLEGTYTKSGSNPIIDTNDNNATTTTDANSGPGNTLNVTATTGFAVGDWIYVHDTQQKNHFARIKSITAGVSLELYQGFDDLDSGKNVYNFDDEGHSTMHFVNYSGTNWHLYATMFQIGTAGVPQEINCLWEGTGTDPKSITWTPSNDPWAIPFPVIWYPSGTQYRFLENPGFIRGTINE